MPGFQVASPENVTTRREVVRWFGLVLLDIHYIADLLTSGTENDIGWGIRELDYTAWVCDNTDHHLFQLKFETC